MDVKFTGFWVSGDSLDADNFGLLIFKRRTTWTHRRFNRGFGWSEFVIQICSLWFFTFLKIFNQSLGKYVFLSFPSVLTGRISFPFNQVKYFSLLSFLRKRRMKSILHWDQSFLWQCVRHYKFRIQNHFRTRWQLLTFSQKKLYGPFRNWREGLKCIEPGRGFIRREGPRQFVLDPFSPCSDEI